MTTRRNKMQTSTTTPVKTRTRKSERVRIWKHLHERENGCWEYVGQACDYPRFMNDLLELEYAHRVAWRLFRGPIPEGLLVLHHCDNPKCCNPIHLFLGTQADNMADKCAKGRQAKGSKHGRAKLTEGEVAEIRVNEHGLHQYELAEIYGVSQQLISFIMNNKLWKTAA